MVKRYEYRTQSRESAVVLIGLFTVVFGLTTAGSAVVKACHFQDHELAITHASRGVSIGAVIAAMGVQFLTSGIGCRRKRRDLGNPISVLRLSPEKATTEGESAGLAVLGQAGKSPAE